MAERKALYLTIAHRCAEQGDYGRAIVTIVNALRNNPQFLDTQPESVDFLAEILIPGFEEEIHRLEALYPSFGYRLYDALAAHGRAEYAHELETSFGEYCIQQMKTVLSETERQSHSHHRIQPLQYEEHFDERTPSYRQTAVGSGLYRPVQKDPWRRRVTTEESCDQAPSVMKNDSSQFPPVQRQPRQYIQDVQSYSNAAIPTSIQRTVSRNACQIEPEFVDDEPTVLLPPDVWMQSIHQTEQNGVTSYEKREFNSQNTDSCRAEGIRRFDRIRTQSHHAEKQETDEFIDTGVDRVIIDFDDCIRSAPRAAMFAASKTRIKTYAEEAAEWRELTRDISPVRRDPVQNPLDLVAETTHALSETPSVEPYSVRHPLRFKLTPQNIFTCAFICLFAVLGFITWKTIEPRLEKSAIEEYSNAYLAASENGSSEIANQIQFRKIPLMDDDWIAGYRLFLSIWNQRFYRDKADYISPDSPAFEPNFSASHAGYIMQEIDRGHIDRAKAHFDAVPAKIWREHPYFKTWAEAQLSAAQGDVRDAANKYEKLLRTPLASFAITELGFLAIDDVTGDIKHRWANDVETVENVPQIARCLHDAMIRNSSLKPADLDISKLKQPFADYCTIGNIYRAISDKKQINENDIRFLESSPTLDAQEFIRLETIIEAALYQQNPDTAVYYYQALSLPAQHPVRMRLLRSILNRTQASGDWTSLNLFMPNLPKRINYLSASHIIDSNLADSDITQTENLLQYGKTASFSGESYLDKAYISAISGQSEQAIGMTRSLLSTHPESLEPLYLQAMILSSRGRNEEAAVVLEQALYSGINAAPLVVFSNLYRVRAGLGFNKAGTLLPLMHFNDASIESARCEILWRQNRKSASKCLSNIAKSKGIMPKSAWIMRHIDRHGRPTGSSAEWAKAENGFLSFPGFYLAKARVLESENTFTLAVKSYTHAILDDPTTSNETVVAELAQGYAERFRKNEGARKLESLIEMAERRHLSSQVIGALYYQTAMLYQPESGRSKVRKNLARAVDYIGETPEIVRAYVEYYSAKEKPEQARIWRNKLK